MINPTARGEMVRLLVDRPGVEFFWAVPEGETSSAHAVWFHTQLAKRGYKLRRRKLLAVEAEGKMAVALLILKAEQ